MSLRLNFNLLKNPFLAWNIRLLNHLLFEVAEQHPQIRPLVLRLFAIVVH